MLKQQVDSLLPYLGRCKAQVSVQGSHFEKAYSRGSYDQDGGEMVAFSGEWWKILFPPKDISPGTKIAALE